MTESYGDEATRRLLNLAAKAKAAYDRGDPTLDQDIAELADRIALVDGLMSIAARVLVEAMDDRAMCVSVFAVWLDQTFPHTVIATYAARRALATLDPANPGESPL